MNKKSIKEERQLIKKSLFSLLLLLNLLFLFPLAGKGEEYGNKKSLSPEKIAIDALEKDSPKKNFFEQEKKAKEAIHALSLIPVQSGGRVKPFDTVAREGLRLFYGKSSLKARAAVEVFLSILLYPDFWKNYPLLHINYKAIKSDLGLEDKKHFSYMEVVQKEKLTILFSELDKKNQNQEKLDPYFQAVSILRNQIFLFHHLVTGKLFAVLPPAADEKTSKWKGLDELSEDLRIPFVLVLAYFESENKEKQKASVQKIKEFTDLLRKKNPSLYPSEASIAREVHYNNFRPFRVSWVLSIITFFFFLAFFFGQKKWLGRLSLALYTFTLLLITYGFYLRVMISGRPPVTNMYESVIWVAFGCALFGFFIYLFYKKPIIPLASLLISIFGFMLADLSPVVLDESIHPLEPVLRSNFWLLIHVVTIALSYAAFALALGISNIALAPFVFFRRMPKLFTMKEMALYAYRAVQLGVLLLGAGTLLGGLWADYSWGRFWGWDPKETWALIAFLGYIALLHARYRGMLQELGFLVASIFSFLLVLMAWYGVNFVLGAGLHSYGFSSGGNIPIFVYIVLQSIFVLYAIFCYRTVESK